MWVEKELAVLPKADPGNPMLVGDGTAGIHFFRTREKNRRRHSW